MKNCPTCNLAYPDDFTLCPHDGGKLQTSSAWENGAVIRQKYRIIGPIGVGGMAAVYEAEHIHFRETRALKVISPALSGDDGFVRRFMQEAVLTRRLQHPNAVRVDDIDRAEDGRPFIVMELIHGISLREAMKPGVPMPIETACRLAKQIASALGAAHKLGMVHRDIKPANIFLSNSTGGQSAKVLDFGIAKVKEDQLQDTRLSNMTLTGTGMVIGTPAYMSPEQAAGKRGDELDGRSDLYSLGVVLYQMLSGELPLNADSDLQLLMAHLATEPVPIQQRLPTLPPLLAYIVMRCLAKDPSQRPNDAQALIAEIEEFENTLTAPPPVKAMAVTEPLPAVPTPPPTRPKYIVDYATAQQNKQSPFFTKAKMAVLAVILTVAGLVAARTFTRAHNNAEQAKAAVPVVEPPPTTLPSTPESSTTAPKTELQDVDPKKDVDVKDDLPVMSQNDHPVVNTIKPTAPPTKPISPPAKSSVTAEKPIKSQPQPEAAAQTWGQFADPKASPTTPQPQVPQEPASTLPAIPQTAPVQQPAYPSQPQTANQPLLNSNAPSVPGTIYTVGPDVSGPTLLTKAEPKYSQEARSFRYSGMSILAVVVDERGVPIDVRVVRAAGYGLDRQAIETITNWRFNPGRRQGVPVRVRIGVQVSFRYAGLFSFAKSTLFR